MKSFVVALSLLVVVSGQNFGSMMSGSTGSSPSFSAGLSNPFGNLASMAGGMGGSGFTGSGMRPGSSSNQFQELTSSLNGLSGGSFGSGSSSSSMNSVASGPLSTFLNMLPDSIRNMPAVKLFIDALNRLLSMIPGFGGMSSGSGFGSQSGSNLGSSMTSQMGSSGRSLTMLVGTQQKNGEQKQSVSPNNDQIVESVGKQY